MLQTDDAELFQSREQTFAWTDGVLHHDHHLERTHYSGFTLNDVTYSVGDCVMVVPETENDPVYMARIVSAFADRSAGAAVPMCIEVSLSVSRQLFF